MSDQELNYNEEVACQSTGDKVCEGGQSSNGLVHGGCRRAEIWPRLHCIQVCAGRAPLHVCPWDRVSRRTTLIVFNKLQRLNSSMEQISDRVRHLESSVPLASKRRATSESSQSVEDWVDREDDDSGDREDPQWPSGEVSFTLSGEAAVYIPPSQLCSPTRSEA